MAAYTTPHSLDPRRHALTAFRCRSAAIEAWLQRHAVNSHQGNFPHVTVTTPHGSDEVVAFYALCAAAIEHTAAPEALTRGGGQHPIPAILLAQLGVHTQHEGRGLGRHMVLDAIRRSSAISTHLGARALMVHCESRAARDFYLSVLPSFVPLPGEPMTLVLSMKAIKATGL